MNIHFNILSIVSEGFTENREASHVLGVVVNRQTETEAAAIIQVEAVNGHV